MNLAIRVVVLVAFACSAYAEDFLAGVIENFVKNLPKNLTDVSDMVGNFGKKQNEDSSWMYVFAYSWTPGFCGTQSNDPGCSTPQSYWKTHFTLHGLWPQYTDNGYPSFCTTEAFDPSSPEEVGMSTMETYWPNVQANPGDSDYDDFWMHEWTKHGTCSTLDQTTYYQTAINLIKQFGTPSVVSSNIGKSIAADDIRDGFGGSDKVLLKCSSGSLTGAYTCWTQSNGIPSSQVSCPSSTKGEDNCGTGSVTIKSL